ncbi:MAG: phosphoglycerate kinase [Gemmatimonadota bacterium]|nr:phosphoglycerate kinase [Gemmatimonadota bacterium]
MPRTLRDLESSEVARKRALVRVDYNVPLEGGRVADATRVEASLPTLRWLLERDVRPVLLSHLGRPGGEPRDDLSLAPVARTLEDLLGSPVRFAAPCDGQEAREAVRALEFGQTLLLENTRFLPGETKNDRDLARRLARLGDLFVSDAFGSLHRAHASTVGVTEFLRPAVAGLLVEREVERLGALADPPRPFVVAFGGAKIGDKIELLRAFLDRSDRLLVGGAMANTFLRARGHAMGRSLVEEEAVDFAREILDAAGDRVELPSDLTVTDGVGDPASRVWTVRADRVPEDAAAVDIGPVTQEAYGSALTGSASFFWNGPMGLFEDERFAAGTFALARAAARATEAGCLTVIGGGDSASAVRAAGLSDAVSHVSTGGGAALEYLSKGRLPGLEALDPARGTSAIDS